MNKPLIGLVVAGAIIATMVLLLSRSSPSVRDAGPPTTPPIEVDAPTPLPTEDPAANPTSPRPAPTILSTPEKAPLALDRSQFIGRVIDLEGDPIEGAEIQAVPSAEQRSATPTPVDDPRHWATSDGNGAFEIASLPAETAFHLYVTHPDAVGARRLSVYPSDAPREFILRPGARARGAVIDSRGHPVAGARVSSGPSYTFNEKRGWRAAGWGGLTLDDLYSDTETGPDGQFDLGGIGGKAFSLRAFHPDYSASDPRNLQRGVDGVILTLGPPIVVEGIVVDDDGTPLAGASVRVRRGPEVVGPVFTDAAGAFRLPGLSAGTDALIGHLVGHSEQSIELTPPLIVGETRSGIELVLHRTATLSGRVVDAEGAPIEGAKVLLLEPGVTWDQAVIRNRMLSLSSENTNLGTSSDAIPTTDASGRFEILKIRPSLRPDFFHGIQVVHRDYLTVKRRNEFACSPGSRTEIGDVILTPAPRVSGLVVTPDGAGIAGAIVQLHRAKERPPHPESPRLLSISFGDQIVYTEEKTDADGRFSLASAGESEVQITAWAPGRQRVSTDPFPIVGTGLAGSVEGIEVVLPEASTLSGILVGDDGEPCAEVLLRAWDRMSRGEATTAEDGSFAIPGLSPEPHRISIQKPGWTLEDPNARYAPASEPLILRALAPGAIEAQVVDIVTGNAVTEFAFGAGTAASPSSKLRRESVDPEGIFFIEPIRAGQWYVGVKAPGYVAWSDRVDVAPRTTTEITIHLEPAADLVGRVVDARGTAIEGATVRVSSSGDAVKLSEQATTTDGDGAFLCEGLLPGTYDLRIGHTDAIPFSRRGVVLTAGAVNDLGALVLESGGGLEGRLTLSDGSAIAWGNVRLVPVDRDGEKFGDFDPQSQEYSVTGVAPGRYTLIVGYPSAGATRTYTSDPIHVQNGDARRLDLVLPSE